MTTGTLKRVTGYDEDAWEEIRKSGFSLLDTGDEEAFRQVEQAIMECGMSAAQQSCRAMGHRWPRLHSAVDRRLVTIEAKVVTESGKIVEAIREMECAGKCGTVRRDLMRRTRGGILIPVTGKTRYIYSSGYLAPPAKQDADGVSQPRMQMPDRREFSYVMLAAAFSDLQW